MTVQITILGLGQVGSSIGLALANQKNIKRVGHDKDYEIARLSQKAGAVDEIKVNLPSSVSNANIVVLSMPLSEIRDTLGYIAQDVQEGTVILDTAPAKGEVASWVGQLIPQGRYYVGLSPAAGSNYLHGIELGVDSARADLFKDGLFLVNAPAGTPSEALDLASNLVRLLGAQVMFTDSVEADGLLASTHVLPQLAAAALLDATVSQPGWTEARKVAARPYASVTAGIAYHDEVKSLRDAALSNRENTVRMLDAYMTSLQKLRDQIQNGNEAEVSSYLEDAVKARDRWIQERARADWQGAQQSDMDSVTLGARMNQLFMGNLFGRNKNKK
ncbi:MAG TPA: prephenate dehydrogenase/arogenate dehydrogenase family protein [Anaerolineales bacterium]|nr:prephenate dehydrogenase/arogenate dehydrogenase family protein [Anaerolineales bacterium]